jgi:hypothetical protein
MPYPPAYPYFMPNPGMPGTLQPANPYSMGGVFVEIKSSSRPVRLDRVISPGQTMPVCMSPCRQVLPRNSVYIITGDGVRSTSQFVLPDDRDRVVLDVKPGSSGDVVFGAVAAGAGLISMYVGLIFVAASEIKTNGDSYYQENRNTGPGKTVGGAMIVGGLIAGIVGLYYIFSTKTEVTSSTGAHFTETPAPKRSRFALTARGLEF